MAGFRRDGTRSKSGRKIQPTPKVRDILCESLHEAVQEAFVDVEVGEHNLRVLMKKQGDRDHLVQKHQQWTQACGDLDGLLQEVETCPLMTGDDLAAYNQRRDQLARGYRQLDDDVAQYQPEQDHATGPAEKKVLMKNILHRTRELETEINQVEKRLNKMALEEQEMSGRVEQDARRQSQPDTAPGPPPGNPDPVSHPPAAPRRAVSSTPRDDGRPPVTPNLSHVPATSPAVDATAAALARLATVLEGKAASNHGRLPKIEPEVFKGDLTAFPAWWNAFQTMVESRAHSEQEKLFYLNKFTGGPANDCVKAFLGLYTDEGAYRRARNVVQTRFGNRLKIAEAFKAKLSAWPRIKDGDGVGLQSYADFLWQCQAAMESLDYLTNLNCQEENTKMAVKLPKVVIQRWDRLVDDAMYGEELDVTDEPTGVIGHFPSFQEFCRFTSREARILVGSCVKQEAAQTQSGGRRSTALHTDARQQQKSSNKDAAPKCEFCSADHMTYQCSTFLANRAEFKRQFARDKGLCFGCLRRSHVYRQCKIRNAELMREPEAYRGIAEQPKTTSLLTQGEEHEGHSSMVVPVWVYNDDNEDHRILVYALLDSQSSSCFMTSDLVNLLQLDTQEVKLELTTLGSRRCVSSSVVAGTVRIQSEAAGPSIALPRCYTRNSIPGSHDYIPRPEQVAEWPHLRDIAGELSSPRPEIPFGLLIGFNCSEATCVDEVRRGDRQQPYAVKSVLGWTVVGCLHQRPPGPDRCLALNTRVREINNEQMCRAFDQGFEDPRDDATPMSHDDERFLQQVRAEIRQMPSGRFQVPLPFRETPTDLPDSRPMAYQRLMSVKRRMQRDDGFRSMYSAFMNGMIEAGQAERVPLPDGVPIARRWYWGHHGVVHPRKPGKIRGVFDGAAEVAGVSINSRLLTGPDQTNNLVGVLSRFRREKVAVTCDIEGMFLQVEVRPRDRDFLRFLWFAGGDPDAPVQEYRMCVNLFGAASSPGTSGMALRATADRYECEFGKTAADFVRDDFYVDDGLGATPDDESALQLITASRGLCAAGGFNLHKFACSSRAVMEKIPDAWRAPSLKGVEIRQQHLPNERALGLLMSLERDALLFAVSLLKKPDTRRGYLSSLSSVFDPLGLVSPALLPGRLILQGLCFKKFGWDSELDRSVAEEWGEWYRGLRELDRLVIPRCVRRTVELPLESVVLHTFADASSRGYGACCYLVIADATGSQDATLVYAKSRVAPAKTTTVPRLELQAAVLAVKMGAFMASELKYPDIRQHYWSDSTVALGYIMNESRRFHVYVANRSQYIRSRTDANQWHHIATERNPADLASRGVTGAHLAESELWWTGPPDILSPILESVNTCEVEADDPELKKVATSLFVKSVDDDPIPMLLGRASTWARAAGALSRCYHFIDRVRGSPMTSPVAALQRAERRLVTFAQEETLTAEIAVLRGVPYPTTGEQLRSRKAGLKPESNLYKLDAFCDEAGMVRVGGRLRRAGWPRDMVHPLVLPAEHRVTTLLVQRFHRAGGHMGTTTTLNTVRQSGYWVLGGKRAIERVVRACVVCRRKRGAVGEQRMADLPVDRLTAEAPFTHAAADLFGPFLVKSGRSQVKWWVCEFVCMASRAVHLEPVGSLDVSGFLQAYRRFVARRGPVRTLRCDRGTNFTGAENELNRAWNESERAELTEAMKSRRCDIVDFRFNYPKASHMAGSWERMIRTVRSALWEALRQHGASLSFEVFSTTLVEAEALVNSRPLTTVDASDDTTPRPLTPNQLLTLKPTTVAPPPGEFVPEDRYARKRWRTTQYLVNQFWRRWVKDYILSQQSRCKWQKTRPEFQLGDVVLLVDPDVPRGDWPLGRIISVAPSDDDLVRKVTVKTATGQLDRPIQKLVLLYRPPEES